MCVEPYFRAGLVQFYAGKCWSYDMVLYYPILTEHPLGILVGRRQEEMGLEFFALGCLDRGMM